MKRARSMLRPSDFALWFLLANSRGGGVRWPTTNGRVAGQKLQPVQCLHTFCVAPCVLGSYICFYFFRLFCSVAKSIKYYWMTAALVVGLPTFRALRAEHAGLLIWISHSKHSLRPDVARDQLPALSPNLYFDNHIFRRVRFIYSTTLACWLSGSQLIAHLKVSGSYTFAKTRFLLHLSHFRFLNLRLLLPLCLMALRVC